MGDKKIVSEENTEEVKSVVSKRKIQIQKIINIQHTYYQVKML
ncbi:hypothetical protein OGZ02_10265 [Brachyspira hyodysenteriae]|nr:hypothetical protein [Brachyspira hyodysenteriae]MDA1469222.1 hypothetical protein [Brachyspira hyodysenteriae]